MKKRQLQEETFEEFLQESVKGHRMYPSDQLWSRIRTDMHGNRSWPALTFISLLIISSLTVFTLINNHPNQHQLPLLPDQVVSNTGSSIPKKEMSADEKVTAYFSSIAPDNITLTTIASLNTQISDDLFPSNINKFEPVHVITQERQGIQPLNDVVNSLPAATTSLLTINEINTTPGESILLDGTTEQKESGDELKSSEALKMLAMAKGNQQQSADEFFRSFPFTANGPVKYKSSRIGFQFYVTPSISFRILKDAKLKEINSANNATNVSGTSLPISSSVPAGVNDIVRHRPAVGLELGFNILYSINRNFQLTTGVQLNLRRYDIETFISRTRDLSSLSLVNNRGIETISFYSPYNNNNGYRATILHNDLYQISLPVGINWKVFEGKKWGISAEASVQPTLSIKTNTWLVSADYKHYTEGNDLLRKWNINSAAGFQITYAGKNAVLGIGPQIRYQHLPTYSNLYPIKENLIDYGIRMSITRPQRK
ncbi:MAG: outer membrane beta-barrel protein [Sediminibacterium sp.]